jgi:hypothetical protein
MLRELLKLKGRFFVAWSIFGLIFFVPLVLLGSRGESLSVLNPSHLLAILFAAIASLVLAFVPAVVGFVVYLLARNRDSLFNPAPRKR